MKWVLTNPILGQVAGLPFLRGSITVWHVSVVGYAQTICFPCSVCINYICVNRYQSKQTYACINSTWRVDCFVLKGQLYCYLVISQPFIPMEHTFSQLTLMWTRHSQTRYTTYHHVSASLNGQRCRNENPTYLHPAPTMILGTCYEAVLSLKNIVFFSCFLTFYVMCPIESEAIMTTRFFFRWRREYVIWSKDETRTLRSTGGMERWAT